jgi:hypothetical protein
MIPLVHNWTSFHVLARAFMLTHTDFLKHTLCLRDILGSVVDDYTSYEVATNQINLCYAFVMVVSFDISLDGRQVDFNLCFHDEFLLSS